MMMLSRTNKAISSSIIKSKRVKRKNPKRPPRIIRSNGVIHECTSELMEMIKIARADLIGADGTVNG